ncbi:hypothetical protein FGO68_gene6148 [Halteria grandinella]|uniref:Uncharacterized protein n=1 Tax=Halteria grandinella TaxID=5974 RepID=A0A8J8P771_HALGN|nr:hypothetical protein FGO68_gene6148 [Halteria grandinella]
MFTLNSDLTFVLNPVSGVPPSIYSKVSLQSKLNESEKGTPSSQKADFLITNLGDIMKFSTFQVHLFCFGCIILGFSTRCVRLSPHLATIGHCQNTFGEGHGSSVIKKQGGTSLSPSAGVQVISMLVRGQRSSHSINDRFSRWGHLILQLLNTRKTCFKLQLMISSQPTNENFSKSGLI